ncbi:aerobic-type carbon monoxide dehydrogenase small subunit (CoxS/CutS family) [Bradyrhizobium algeriense]|uniref:Aerobic-type carbon monoxide dehydrogenase small subunit (CoxS/CutS family) n=1 Tax=Bradyrhizobium algeriense TaxID=634784 RepID=A0ABU8BI18_9BRAD
MSELHAIALAVNGRKVDAKVEPRRLLADFLRRDLDLTGTHIGCEHGVCGACTILVDGVPVRSCLMFAVQADGCEVVTIEGLAGEDGRLSPLQQEFREHHALQCGFCTPGVLISLTGLLDASPDPDEATIRDVVSGHICRCTGYQAMIAAARAVGGRVASGRS